MHHTEHEYTSPALAKIQTVYHSIKLCAKFYIYLFIDIFLVMYSIFCDLWQFTSHISSKYSIHIWNQWFSDFWNCRCLPGWISNQSCLSTAYCPAAEYKHTLNGNHFPSCWQQNAQLVAGYIPRQLPIPVCTWPDIKGLNWGDQLHRQLCQTTLHVDPIAKSTPSYWAGNDKAGKK